MNAKENTLISHKMDKDGIYYAQINNVEQNEEVNFRKGIASKSYDNDLDEISKHHSIPVMDNEVRRFINQIPPNGKIIDIGGCWGWHWRDAYRLRSDIDIFIVDFVRENLMHAKSILGNQVGRNIYLVEDDATSLQFPDNTFDGIWTVQTFQHIPNFEKAILEAYRILKNKGHFVNYSFNNQSIVRFIYKILKKKYPINEYIEGQYFLSRSSKSQIRIIENIFRNKVEIRYSEIIFSPELMFTTPGQVNSFLGKLDTFLSSSSSVFKLIARQESCHTQKISS